MNAVGTSARFSAPQGIAADSSGNVFVADAENDVMRVINVASRSVSTLAGGGAGGTSNGYADGIGSNALFLAPSYVAADASGLLFVSDVGNSCIRRINTATMLTTTFVGGGSSGFASGFADGTGSNALFGGPMQLAFDPTFSTLFVADAYNHAIRAVSLASRAVTTIAGGGADAGSGAALGSSGYADGAGAVALFSLPQGLAVDPTGSVLVVAEVGSSLLRTVAIGAGGQVATLAGGFNFDAVGAAPLFAPCALVIDARSTVYVASGGDNAVLTVSLATGATTLLAGSASGAGGFADGAGTSAALFSGPGGLALDPTTTELYVSDTASNAVRRIGGVRPTATASPSTAASLSPSSTASGSRSAAPTATTVCCVPSTTGTTLLNSVAGASWRVAGGSGGYMLLQLSAAASGALSCCVGCGGCAGAVGCWGCAVAGGSSAQYKLQVPVSPDTSVAIAASAQTVTLLGTCACGGVTAPSLLQASSLATMSPSSTASTTTSASASPALTSTVSGTATFTRSAARSASVRPSSTPSTTASTSSTLSSSTTASGTVSSTQSRSTMASASQTVSCSTTVSATASPTTTVSASGQASSSLSASSTLSSSGTRTMSPSATLSPSPASSLSARPSPSSFPTPPPPPGPYGNPNATTFVGGATSGSTDGTGTSALLFKPYSIALSGAAGGAYMYIADTFNHKIRAVSAAGVATTLVGGGAGGATPGSTQGVGTACLFNYPYGIAANAAGSVLVADTYNHRVRVVSPSGLSITTLAGGGASGVLQGTADGVGSNALFYRPAQLAVGPTGVVFVSDSYNHRVRAIALDGTVTTLAGGGASKSQTGATDGVGSSALFNFPYGLDVSASGDTVFVCDALNSRIRAIDTGDGTVTTVAGGGGAASGGTQSGSVNGVGTSALFNQPAGVAVGAEGILFIGDAGGYTIRAISPDGLVTRLAGGGSANGITSGYADGQGSAALFSWPWGLAYDPAGILYVADSANSLVRALAPVGPTAPPTPTASRSAQASRSPSAAASLSMAPTATASATVSPTMSAMPTPSAPCCSPATTGTTNLGSSTGIGYTVTQPGYVLLQVAGGGGGGQGCGACAGPCNGCPGGTPNGQCWGCNNPGGRPAQFNVLFPVSAGETIMAVAGSGGADGAVGGGGGASAIFSGYDASELIAVAGGGGGASNGGGDPGYLPGQSTTTFFSGFQGLAGDGSLIWGWAPSTVGRCGGGGGLNGLTAPATYCSQPSSGRNGGAGASCGQTVLCSQGGLGFGVGGGAYCAGVGAGGWMATGGGGGSGFPGAAGGQAQECGTGGNNYGGAGGGGGSFASPDAVVSAATNYARTPYPNWGYNTAPPNNGFVKLLGTCSCAQGGIAPALVQVTSLPTATMDPTRTAKSSATTSASRSSTATTSGSVSPSAAASPSVDPSDSPSSTASRTGTVSPSATMSGTRSSTGTGSRSASPSSTFSPTSTTSWSTSSSGTASMTGSRSATLSPTLSSSPTLSAARSPSPTVSASLTTSASASAAPSPSAAPTASFAPPATGVMWQRITNSGPCDGGSYPLYGAAISADGTFMAVASNRGNGGGTICTSADGGSRWTQQGGAGNFPYSGLAMSTDGSRIVAITGVSPYAGYIYLSADFGATWTQTPSLNQRWLSVACDATCSRIVAGASGVWQSRNGGASWANISPSGAAQQPGLVASSADGARLVAAVYSSNVVFVSTNSGLRWSQTAVGSSQSTYFSSAACSADFSLLALAALGNSGAVWTSRDAGVTWVTVGPTGYYNTVAIAANGSTMLAGAGSVASTSYLLWSAAAPGFAGASWATNNLNPAFASSGQGSWTQAAISASGAVFLASSVVNGNSLYVSYFGGSAPARAPSVSWTNPCAAANASCLSGLPAATGSQCLGCRPPAMEYSAAFVFASGLPNGPGHGVVDGGSSTLWLGVSNGPSTNNVYSWPGGAAGGGVVLNPSYPANEPTGVALGPAFGSANILYVSRTQSGGVWKRWPNGTSIVMSSSSAVNGPRGIAYHAPSGSLFVACRGSSSVVRMLYVDCVTASSAAAVVVTTIMAAPSGVPSFSPFGVAVTLSGVLFVAAEASLNSATGDVWQVGNAASGSPSTAVALAQPAGGWGGPDGVSLDAGGNLFVASYASKSWLVPLAGMSDLSGAVGGVAPRYVFGAPTLLASGYPYGEGIAVDPCSGSVYACTQTNPRPPAHPPPPPTDP